MTANLINYWKHKEDQRANRINEAETERYHRASTALGYAQLGEAARHNKAMEDIGKENNLLMSSRDEETARHNKVGESNTAWDLSIKTGRSTWEEDAARKKAETDRYRAKTDRYAFIADTIIDAGGLVVNAFKAATPFASKGFVLPKAPAPTTTNAN